MVVSPTVTIVEDSQGLAKRAADLFVTAAKEAAAEKRTFYAAVSGGSTPRAMHRLLAKSPYRDEIPWEVLHLFWVDDRCVSFDDPASNFGTAGKDFLSKVPVPEGQLHPMPTKAPPEKGAATYEKEMARHLPVSPSGFPRFDMIFLGIGLDGHTASLFPGQGAVEEKWMWVLAVKGGNPDVHRLTMTLPVLNNARQIVFLVTGTEKAPVARAVLEDKDVAVPASRVHPVDGCVTWLLDRDAASMLSEEVRCGAS